jgi:inner membrane protein
LIIKQNTFFSKQDKTIFYAQNEFLASRINQKQKKTGKIADHRYWLTQRGRRMTAKGHVLLAVPAALTPVLLEMDFSPQLTAIWLAAVGLGAVFPDIDEPNSYIGRRLTMISVPISMAVEHRGLTHIFATSLIFVAAAVVLYFLFSTFWGIVALGFGIGWLMHTAGDLLTIGGIRGYFRPLSNKTIWLTPKFLRFRTGGAVETVLIAALFALDCYLGYLAFGEVDFASKLRSPEGWIGV